MYFKGSDQFSNGVFFKAKMLVINDSSIIII